jgi:hypothetical protein
VEASKRRCALGHHRHDQLVDRVERGPCAQEAMKRFELRELDGDDVVEHGVFAEVYPTPSP